MKAIELMKKPYSKPQLQVYGDMREITQHVANGSGHPDGDTNPNHNHTH
jgi:hypothetical protein